jgi:hypothetical protein
LQDRHELEAVLVQVRQPEKQEKQAVTEGVPMKPLELQSEHVVALLTGLVQLRQATLQGSQ